MYEDYQESDFRELELSIRQGDLEIIDQVLLADLGRSWERLGINAPHNRRGLEGWSYNPEDQRRTPLGKSLLIIAAFAEGKRFLDREYVEQAMKLVYRQLYGDSLSTGYMLSPAFEKTELGQIFQSAYLSMYDIGELISAKKAYTLLGISRPSLYDRASEGKLQRFGRHGSYLFVRSEIEEWKIQREQRRNRSKS